MTLLENWRNKAYGEGTNDKQKEELFWESFKKWYNDNMAKTKNKRKGRKTRRPTKAELEKQRAIKRMVFALFMAFVLFFAIFNGSLQNLFNLGYLSPKSILP